MTYIIQNNNILDSQSSKGIGINIPFNGSTGLNITYNTKDAIRANLLNFLLTGTRERIMNPNIGSNIREQIFEQISTKNFQNIKNLISGYIQNNFPSVKLNELIINEQNNLINISFTYSIINTNIEDNIQLNFNND